MSRHDAIHAIGAVISEDMLAIMTEDGNKTRTGYKERLEKLSAKKWKNGQW